MQLADPQFGMFAGSSGKTDEGIATFTERGLLIGKTPKFEGFAPETALFTRAIEHANRLKPAFVVVCGDMINQSENDDQIAEVKRIGALLDDSIPLHWVAGNHDVAVRKTRLELRVVGEPCPVVNPFVGVRCVPYSRHNSRLTR